MKVKLVKPNKIEKGKAGDIVEVSPNRALFLMRFGLAEAVSVREQAETPEKKTAVKTTRAAKAAPAKKEAKTAKAVRTKK